MAAALHEQHAPARLRQPVRDDRPRRAAADHDGVGRERVAVQRVVRHGLDARKRVRHVPRGLGVARPVLERHVADRGVRARVAVEAEVRHLHREPEHRLDEAAQEAHAPVRDVVDEALLDEAATVLELQLRQRRLEEAERVQPQPDQRDVHDPLALRAERAHVAVDVPRHLARRDDARVHRDLRQRGERAPCRAGEKAPVGGLCGRLDGSRDSQAGAASGYPNRAAFPGTRKPRECGAFRVTAVGIR